MAIGDTDCGAVMAATNSTLDTAEIFFWWFFDKIRRAVCTVGLRYEIT